MSPSFIPCFILSLFFYVASIANDFIYHGSHLQHWPKNFMACIYLLIFNNEKNHAKNEQQRSYFSFYNNRALGEDQKGKKKDEKGNVCLCECVHVCVCGRNATELG